MRITTIALLLLALLNLPLALALAPSEVLYNPTGTDNGLEFIELTGNENLTLCTVRDLFSSDALELLHADESDTILIVESDGVYGNITGATIYGAGAAIGNGLANTAETVTISCNDTVLVEIAYNTSLLPEIPDGASIVWHDNAWIAGVVGGTPGVLDVVPPVIDPTPNTTTNTTTNTTIKPSHSGSSGPSVADACNTTLLITMGATQGSPDDTVAFTIMSAEYASWEALTDNGMLAYGDTMTSHTHAITLPYDVPEVRLIAESRACGGRQRATRYIAIVQPPAPVQNVTAVAATEVAAIQPPADIEPEQPVAVPVKEIEPPVTSHVVVDEDRNAIPWIAGFGIITVLASAAVFVLVHKKEKEDATEAKYLRTRWARQEHDNVDGEAGERTSQTGLGTRRRHVRGRGSA